MEPTHGDHNFAAIGISELIPCALVALTIGAIMIYNILVLAYHCGRKCRCVEEARDSTVEGFPSISASIRNSNATYPRIVNALLGLISGLFIALFILEYVGRHDDQYRIEIDEEYVITAISQAAGALFITGISAFKAKGDADKKQRCRNLHFVFTMLAYACLFLPQAYFAWRKYCTPIGLISCILCPMSFLSVLAFFALLVSNNKKIARIEVKEAPSEHTPLRKGPTYNIRYFWMYLLEMLGFYIIFGLCIVSTMTRNKDFTFMHPDWYQANNADCF